MTAAGAGATPGSTATARPGVTLEARIKAQAYGLGFDLVGLTRTGPAHTADTFDGWLQAGHAGEMQYLARGADKRRDSRLPVDGARSAIVVAMARLKKPSGSSSINAFITPSKSYGS